MTNTNLQLDFADLRLARERFRRGCFADKTIRGYGYDWAVFRKWCEARGREALPASADTVSLYITDLLEQGNKVASARRRAAGIVHHHRQAGHESPVTKETWRLMTSARRLRGERKRQMRPLSVAHLREICEALTPCERDIRDRAILTVGFVLALRSATLVELDFGDVEFCPEGAILIIRREKQNRVGSIRELGLPLFRDPQICPVRALREWLAIRPAVDEALFTQVTGVGRGLRMSTQAVYRLVKRALGLIGASADGYGSHSMRAGLVTACGEKGVPELVIAATTGHSDLRVLRQYFRRTEIFRVNAAAMLDL